MQRPSFSIYDASAGSGKTYALVKEYLKIILIASKNDAYRNILAITFTNKAVHEMKSRIVDSLSEFTKETPNPKAQNLMRDLVQETGLSSNQIQIKSQQIIKHIIHNYAAFDISTIDKFTHRVIRAFAHDLNLPMNFEVTLDTENLLTEAVDAIIARAGEDETLTKLLIDFTMEKTDDDKSWDISREILETGRLILNENNREEIVLFKDKSIAEFGVIKNKLIATCQTLEIENAALADSLLVLIESNGIDPKSFSGSYFPNHLLSIQQRKFNPANKTYHESDHIKINKNTSDANSIELIVPQLLKILGIIYKNFEERDFYKAFLKNITPLSLLNTVSNELAKIQNEQQLLSISEFNAIIHNEIQNQPAPFIYERLGNRYRHFFIDEFQDTSEMQWQNLVPLIDNATSSEIDGEKGTLMIVGDPKQSIYRWRGGKAEQFIALSKEQNPFSNPDKKLEHLDKNYRSYSEIIDFNNQFFQLLSTEFSNVDYKDLYQNHSHQHKNEQSGGFVSLAFLPAQEKTNNTTLDDETSDKTDLYVEATRQIIQKVIQQGFEFKDIAILTRKRDQGIAIANYLTEHQIPLLSSETLMIQNATEVRVIINLLRYLNNAADLQAKAHLLQYMAGHNQHRIPVHDFIAQGMGKIKESDFENWLCACNSKSSKPFSFQNLRKKSLYEIVESIISIFMNPENNNAYVQYFLDIVLERDIRNQAGIADFLIFWDKNAAKFSIPSPEGNNAVRIMTIHKSKGLEFPVVILPFAEEDYNRKPKNKLWLNAKENTIGLPKVLIDNTSAVAGFGIEALAVYEQKKQEELLDNINVLYVALTRAEEQLYVVSQLLQPKKDGLYPDNMSSLFIKYLMYQGVFRDDQLTYDFGDCQKKSPRRVHVDKSKKIELITEILDPQNIKIAQKESLMWGTNQQEAIEYGNLIHEILSFIKVKEDIDNAVKKAIENGIIALNQKESVDKTIRKIVNHAELQPYFSANFEILNEHVIIQQEGKSVKPDRIVITPTNEVYLLDYKTGSHQSKYEQQLTNYQQAIEKMGYSVTKMALLYVGEQIKIVNL